MPKVLYVDDDEDIREIALLSLGLEPDLEIRGASSGAEAIEVVPAWLPDIILLDVMMPVLDGPATLQKLQELNGSQLPPVVFCTARAQARDHDFYLSLGAAGVIPKPFDPMKLGKTVKEFLP